MRLSLRRKIVGGYGLLLLLIVLLAWLTLSLFASLRSVQRRVFDEAVPGLVVVDEIVRSYSTQSAALRGYVIGSQPALLDQYRNEVEISRAAEQDALELFDSGETRRLLLSLTETGERFHALVDDTVLPLVQRGRRSLAFSFLSQQGTPLVSEIEALGADLRRVQDRIVSQTEDDVSSRTAQTVVTLLLVTLGALLVGTVLAVVLPRRLTANLLKLVDAARAIGRGDFDQRIEVRSGDEVEELAQRFAEMQAGLQRLRQLAAQDRELEIAGTIQRKMIQRDIPQTPGAQLLPVQKLANLVGGDWYDVDARESRLVVAVGDASGKGIGAALMATVALSTIRVERRLGAPPKRIVERTNQALREATEPESFTTLVYATVDLDTGQARWLNMGHPSPFLVRRDGADGAAGGFFVDGPRNKVLGWFEEPGAAETVVHLYPGDRLVFYTDGFIEAKDGEGQEFGEARLAETLTKAPEGGLEELGDELVRQVERHAAGKLEDDLTMLIVEYQGAPTSSSGETALTGEEPWHSRR